MSSIIDILRAQHGLLSMQTPSLEQIRQAEASLGVRFAQDYREYISAFGVAAYNGHELTGICASPRLSVVDVTQREREEYATIPADWYVIEQLNIDGIVIWQGADGAIYQTMQGASPQRICGSLSEYITQ